jgi:hypothetical protein
VEESQKWPFAMRKTDVKTKTLNPVWEETFCFYNLDVSSSLVVSIFDHDIVGSHDFLGRVLLPIQSLPINQSLESWFPLQARSDDEEVSGSVCLHLRLQTDKRKRIERLDGETFVSEIDINGDTLNLMRDSSSNDVDPRPATIFPARIKDWRLACQSCRPKEHRCRESQRRRVLAASARLLELPLGARKRWRNKLRKSKVALPPPSFLSRNLLPSYLIEVNTKPKHS